MAGKEGQGKRESACTSDRSPRLPKCFQAYLDYRDKGAHGGAYGCPEEKPVDEDDKGGR
ncbi:MAG: hypothetical protein ABSC19_07865 [Syntrophorhabdales bacterium]|jgi:hypothetical protein